MLEVLKKGSAISLLRFVIVVVVVLPPNQLSDTVVSMLLLLYYIYRKKMENNDAWQPDQYLEEFDKDTFDVETHATEILKKGN